MTTEHTPGPWKVLAPCKGATDYDEGLLWVGAGDDLLVGRIDKPSDARLIAAAPELLAACKEAMAALAVIIDYTQYDNEEDGPSREFVAYYAATRAVTKAEGDKPG